MIRTTVAMFVFALFLCGLIIFRPFADDDTVAQNPLGVPIEETAEVTRASTPEISSLAQAAVSATAPIPAAAPAAALTWPAPTPTTRGFRT